jgi:hypothetical protein
MKKLLLLFLYASTCLGQSAPSCPPESFLIEFNSPITGGKKSFCAYQKDGATVKHGDELSFDKSGSLIKKTSYQHGTETSAASPEIPKNLPGTNEAVLIKSEAKLLGTISDLIRVLTLKKTHAGGGTFKVGGCDPTPLEWVKGALMKTPINKTYAFGEQCDVSGGFSANFGKEFPMAFQLRNLEDFIKTNLTVKMSLNKSQSGLRYRFEVLDGFIAAATRNANFKAEYEIDVDPFSGDAMKGTQQGKLTLTQIDGKPVQAEAPLKFED